MRKTVMLLAVTVFTFMCIARAEAGAIDVLVNKLVEKQVLTPYEAQILLAEANEEAAKEVAQGKAVTAPAWTQKIKVKGDVRFRTQLDWGKNKARAHQQIRNRIRARVQLEGKVNDEVKAGVRLASGSSDDPRSTNQTLDGLFQEKNVWFDKMWIDWEPQLPSEIGRGNVLLGKFSNPFVKSELMWDGDINPEGVGIKYMSPVFSGGGFPQTNIYGNFGMFWLDEITASESDVMLYGFQGGMKMLLNSDWDTKLNLAVAYYDTANAKDKNSLEAEDADTNTTWPATDPNYAGNLRYDFNMLDIIIQLDQKRLFDFEIPHGLYSDFIWNTAASDDEFAFQVGGYLGTKKPKKPGQWKLWGEYRYIQQDAILDLLPDSDFYGFTAAGAPAGGGTNGYGFNGGIKYAIFKNTVLAAEYYYCVPVDIDNSLTNEYDEPYQLLQLDIAVKF